MVALLAEHWAQSQKGRRQGNNPAWSSLFNFRPEFTTLDQSPKSSSSTGNHARGDDLLTPARLNDPTQMEIYTASLAWLSLALDCPPDTDRSLWTQRSAPLRSPLHLEKKKKKKILKKSTSFANLRGIRLDGNCWKSEVRSVAFSEDMRSGLSLYHSDIDHLVWMLPFTRCTNYYRHN